MFRPYKSRIFAEGGGSVLPVSKTVPPSSGSTASAPRRRAFWSFDDKSGFVATKTHEEAEQEVKARPPRPPQSHSNKGNNRFWNYDVQHGFRAAKQLEEAEKSGKNINKYKPYAANSNVSNDAKTPSGWSTPTTETGTAQTAMTTPSRSVKTTKSLVPAQVTTNNYGYSQPYQTNNQKINEQRMLKRQLEQQVQHKLQSPQRSPTNPGSPMRQSVSKSPQCKPGSPTKTLVRKVQGSGNQATLQSPQRQVSNQSRPVQPGLTRKQQLRNQSIAQRDPYQSNSGIHSEREESVCYPPPPVKSIHFIANSVSPITSPVLTGSKKKVDERIIQKNLHNIAAPVISKRGNQNQNEAPTGKGKKKIIRKVVKKRDPNARRERQERILAEKEAEIRRMEARIQELKLLREIQLLEEELKQGGVQPMPNTKLPSINPISGLHSPTRVKKQPVSIPQQHHRQHAPVHSANQSILPAPSTSLPNTKTKSKPSWMNQSASAAPWKKDSTPKYHAASSVDNMPPPLPPLTSSTPNKDVNPSFLSPGFQQMQENLLKNMQNTSRNPHFGNQPAKKLEIRKPTPLPPKKSALSPREELLMAIKARR